MVTSGSYKDDCKNNCEIIRLHTLIDVVMYKSLSESHVKSKSGSSNSVTLEYTWAKYTPKARTGTWTISIRPATSLKKNKTMPKKSVKASIMLMNLEVNDY